MLGMTESYLIPFALFMKAGITQIGLLASLPNLFTALANSQIGQITARVGSRKKVLLAVVLVQALALYLIPSSFFLSLGWKVPAFIVLATFYTTFGGLSLAPWGSLMCEYLPTSHRSAYFGWRFRINGLIITVASLLAGVTLLAFRYNAFTGFAIIFLTAAVFRSVSWHYLGKMYEPKGHALWPSKKIQPPAVTAQDENLKHFFLYTGAISFSVNFAAPYIQWHLIDGLRYNYLTYTIVVAAANLTTYFMMAPWGRHADRVGNLKIIRICSRFIQLIPFLWLLSGHPVYIVFVQLASGAAWSGYNLCVNTYLFDAVAPHKRVREMAKFNMINGLCIFIGAFLGGQTIKILPPFLGFPFYTLFIISGFLRMASVLGFMSKVKEVRKVDNIDSLSVLTSVIGLKPLPSTDMIIPPPRRKPIAPKEGQPPSA